MNELAAPTVKSEIDSRLYVMSAEDESTRFLKSNTDIAMSIASDDREPRVRSTITM